MGGLELNMNSFEFEFLSFVSYLFVLLFLLLKTSYLCSIRLKKKEETLGFIINFYQTHSMHVTMPGASGWHTSWKLSSNTNTDNYLDKKHQWSVNVGYAPMFLQDASCCKRTTVVTATWWDVPVFVFGDCATPPNILPYSKTIKHFQLFTKI